MKQKKKSWLFTVSRWGLKRNMNSVVKKFMVFFLMIISNHPCSNDVTKPLERAIGGKIKFWEERGVKNHMEFVSDRVLLLNR